MLALTLAQMRRSRGRLAAAGVAIAIGTAFVAATLLASGIITRTSYDAMTASLADTDLVVVGDAMDDADVAAIAEVPGVALAEGPVDGYVQLEVGGRLAFLPSTPVAGDPRLRPQELVDGALPGEGEIALPVATAARLGLEVGSTVTARFQVWEPDPGADVDAEDGELAGDWVERREDLRVAGVVSDPAGAFAAAGGAAVVAPADARRWQSQSSSEDVAPPLDRILVLLDPGEDLDAGRAAVAQAVADEGLTVRSRDEHAAFLAEELTGEADMLTALVLGFAAIALIVAALVIANTFSVLVAQRTRSLALLRCVGATKRQLRRSVALEALLLGALASAVGIAAGIGLAQGALGILGRRASGVPLPAAVEITPWVVLVPLVAGMAVTLVAALTPARAAGRVAPLAAMRPAEAPSTGERGSRSRLVLAVVLSVAGLVLLGGGMVAAVQVDVLVGLASGILGGLLSITGALVGAVFWIPRLLGAAAALLSRVAGPATALAAANTVRNPQRTAATSSALVIGVTLVAMMSTGAATARASLDAELDLAFPVDVTVDAIDVAPDASAGIDPALLPEVEQIDGVEAAAALRGASVAITGGSEDLVLDARFADPTAASALVRRPELLDGLAPGTAIVPARLAEMVGIADGMAITLGDVTPDGQPGDGPGIEVTARVTDLEGGAVLAAADTGAVLAPDAPVAALWIRLADGADPVEVAADVQEVFSEHPVHITGAAVERASFERIISTLLAVVVGLLGVAVVIALVGVANTLSLSVLERRRESATLRAIGLTRRQLRQTLAVEGMLIAGSGAVLGAALGTLYGWVGARTVLGAIAEGVAFAVPWRDLVLLLVVALLAGLAASVLPGRSAARTSPVAALAAE